MCAELCVMDLAAGVPQTRTERLWEVPGMMLDDKNT